MGSTDNDLVPRELIKKIFLQEYKKKPLNKIKVRQLAELCSISRGTFYFYFTDIEAVYEECQQDILDAMVTHNSQINMSTVRGDYQKHAELYTHNLEYYKTFKDKLIIFMTGSEHYRFQEAHIDHIYKHYDRSMDFSSEQNPVKREYEVRFFAAGLNMLITSWIQSNCTASTKDLGEVVSAVTFKGLFPQ